MDLEAFELVILRRPPDAPSDDEGTLERIQCEHLAYHAELLSSGHIATNGRVLDQPDEGQRDPAVLAGRLAIEAMTWWASSRHHGPGGAVRLHARAVGDDRVRLRT